ncbi:MAG: XdhC family protein [Gemmatimonadota bacterium]|nr:MAG: XdhC family protein [Gemmatimonadota bacterium]
MDDRATIWSTAADLASSGVPAALATISRRRGSLPMASDAKMLVTVDGRRWGTVGGGCVEADVTEQALAVVKQNQPASVTHTLNADVAGDIGLSCGGTAEFFVEPVLTSDEAVALYSGVAGAIQQRVPTLVYTSVDWSQGPRKLARMGADSIAVGAPFAAESLAEPPANLATFLDEASNMFVESIPRMPRVVIFGTGHVGAEIAKLANSVGFYVVAIDDREEFANTERLPWANEVIAEDFRAVLDRLKFDEDDYVLATTRGHSFDAVIIERTAASAARYVGMLGSKRKKVVILKALKEAGVPQEALDRVVTPIGLDIGADTPAEIGVSVVAELVKVRRE